MGGGVRVGGEAPGEEFGSFRNEGVRITVPGGNRQRVERPYTAVLHRGFSESVPNVSHIHGGKEKYYEK